MMRAIKKHIAECYRRAEEYKKLRQRASNLGDRKIYLSASREFLQLAKDLKKRHVDHPYTRRRSG